MPRILLTGGRGMVGRNIQVHPLAQKWKIDAPTSEELDLTDMTAVRSYLRRNTPDVVIHAAGRVGGIQANISHPVAFLEANVAIGRNVILAAYEAGVRSFLNLGSTCMYPREAVNPLTEDMILTGKLEPTNEGYALAKIMSLKLCDYIRQEDSSAHFKTLIPCNLYGPYDTFDPEASHLIPAIIHKVHSAKKEGRLDIDVWGDGTARREFMYAPDLADAVLKAVSDLAVLPDAMNIGLGHDYSVNEYYQEVARIIGWNGVLSHDQSKPTGMKQKLCDVNLSRSWGWSAPTNLRDGLAQTYKYYCEKVLT